MARALKIDNDVFADVAMRAPRRKRMASEAVRQGASIEGRATPAALFLSYVAAAPLIAAALAIVADPARSEEWRALMALYGAALIIFFGGVRWGVAVMRAEGPTFRSLLGAALPFFFAMPLFVPGPTDWKLPAIMALLLALLIDDLGATRRGSGAPAWYLAVRLPLTVLIEVAFLVALIA
ncbi:MAG: DUF3429 family protein [Pseudomonadota bacterium]